MHVAGAARVGFVVGCFGVSDSVKVLIKLVNVVCHRSKTISEKQQQRVSCSQLSTDLPLAVYGAWLQE